MIKRFEREQKVFEIKGVKVGGQPGEYPTVLIGSIFHKDHKIVDNPHTGDFNRENAEVLVKMAEEQSDLTGNPSILDVVAFNAKAMERYIDFVSKTTDKPFLLDLAQPEERVKALRYVSEVGLSEATIYNSFDENWRVEEAAAIREANVTSAVLQIFSLKKVWAKDRLDLLTGYGGRRGLLEVAEESGVKNVLVDTGVLDVPSISLAATAIYYVKEKFGLPSGCGPCNATTAWKKGKKQFGEAFEACDSAVDVLTQVAGANFVLYGPVEEAWRVFPACAVVDAILGYQARISGYPPKKPHPLYKVF